MSDLQAYLASKYMSGAKAEAILDRAAPEGKRRKKRKVDGASSSHASGSGGGGMIIEDGDDMGWTHTGGRGKGEDAEEDGGPVVEERRGHFKSKSANSWATVRPSDPSLAPTPSPEPEDDLPVIVEVAAPVSRGGLQSSADLRAENDRRAVEVAAKKKQAERELAKRRRELGDDEEDPTQTVYRDSSGRKIDTKREKAELAKQARADMEEQMKKMEWGKGEVQKSEKERQKREEEAMKERKMARYADDRDMNNEMKDVDRWNDPAAAFLSKKKYHSEQSSAPQMPRYAGPAPPPNRFAILPGYRWDGVDRSNGFEKTMGQSGKDRKMREQAAWQYGSGDM